MDEKKEKCKRCGVPISPKTKRAEFCSPKCKVYWHRENNATTKPEPPQIKDFNKPTNQVPDLSKEPPKTNYTINTGKIAELEKELEAIPDKTKGLGKALAESIRKKIVNLKYNKQ